jgi:glycosyltransferase 2 family protein
MKKIIVTLFKFAISIGLIAYLIWNATQGKGKVNVFTNLVDQPKDWWMLAGAWLFCTAAVLLTFIRWWYLVRALDIPCRFADAIRISFWGFLFNLSPLGIVGGDLIKAAMLAHEQRAYRAKAVASVIFDRVIGLYLLFVVASAAILCTGLWRIDDANIVWISYATLIITVCGAVGIALTYVNGVLNGPLSRAMGRLPRVGPIITSLIEAIGLYRYKPVVLIISSVMSIGVHCLFSFGVYLIARGLPGDVLSLSSHFVIWPLSAAMGVIPFPIGPTEGAVDFLYMHVPQANVTIAAGQGLVVVLCYRLINVLIAGLGIGYYFRNRREVSEAMHENEEESQAAKN